MLRTVVECSKMNLTEIRSSTLAKTKQLVNFGLGVVKDKYFETIHGPTAEDVTKYLDLSGKVCLITGANGGIGLEMTRCLTMRNCHVLMACRNIYAANVVTKNVGISSDRIQLYEANLASLKSVKKMSDQLLKEQRKLDIVILNAGVFGLPWILTDDNLETSFQVNYLSQFYLLRNIEKILAPDARVVFVSSESHRNVKWSIRDQLMPTEDLLSLSCDKYTSIKAYNISKLCGILAMHYFGYKWLNTKKAAFAAHPGSFVKTRLCRNWWPYETLYTLMLPFSKTICQAASTPLYCATSPVLEGASSRYYKDCRRVDESEMASDLRLAFRIHDLTEELLRERITQVDVEEDVAVETPQVEISQQKEMHEQLTPSYSA